MNNVLWFDLQRVHAQVSFGEGQMGISLKNVEARAEVSKVAAGKCGGNNVAKQSSRVGFAHGIA